MAEKKGGRERLDVLLVSRGLAESRGQAKRLILAGAVELPGLALPKPGQTVDRDVDIKLKVKERYVSRGGLKLEAALAVFKVELDGKICADIGASTGGFTDCMLQHGAQRVFAIDVGATQMHESVRRDPRVTLLEHTNAKSLTPAMFPEVPQFAAVDVSFISILRVTAPLLQVLCTDGSVVLLIKPQFEAGREAVSRGRGIIRDSKIHRQILATVMDELSTQGWRVKGLIPSPITGGSGNIEFLCFAEPGAAAEIKQDEYHVDIDDVIKSAGAKLT